MPRRAKGLTAAFVEKTTKIGRHADGGGLYLLVRSREAKFWEAHFTLRGKRRSMGGGPATGVASVKLAEARDWSRQVQAAVRADRDPIAERRAARAASDADEAAARAKAITFRAVADMYIAAHQASWRSAVHRDQWRSSLDRYVLPGIGDLPVAQVDTSNIMLILEPLWRERTETASRVRGRIEATLDYAKARGWREGENPARWRGHLDHLLPARRKAQRVQHHPALPWREVGAFMQRLRQLNGIPAKALEFLILTAARSGEVRGATWSEIGLDHAVWTVPATRIKAGKEHRVPLSEPARAVLREMAKFGSNADDLVFPGVRVGSVMSDVTLAAVVSAAGGGDATPHGFRSTFRDWAHEATTYSRELAEAALAHIVGDATEIAYRRGDAIERRRAMMAAWGKFCDRKMVAGEVVPITRNA
jgi:integrase